MKSRISLCDRTVLKKNLTRFAPVWGLYTLVLMMLLLTQARVERPAVFASDLVGSLQAMPAAACGYALICALVLWGDLYNPRMCNALHALPIRRETWFATNALTGLLFFLLPNLAVGLLALAMHPAAWQVIGMWIVGTMLQYLFFFCLATLCAHISGSRFAVGMVYFIVNFLSVILRWLVDTIYVPLLYGVVPGADFLYELAPVTQMLQDSYLFVNAFNYESLGLTGTIPLEFQEGWGYLIICTFIGVGLLALALRCYRNRDLEKAGDFMAVRGLGPVFLTVYTLCAGALCQLIFGELLAYDSVVFLILGFVIGFFTGLMLLKRTVRVFRWKTLGGFGLFLGAFLITYCVTRLDPLGIVTWIPAPEKVACVSAVTEGAAYYDRKNGPIWEDVQQIEEIQTVHRYAVESRSHRDGSQRLVRVVLVYELKSGRTVFREYDIPKNSTAGKTLRKYVSSPEYVLGGVYTGKATVNRIDFTDPDIQIYERADIDSLLAAILADCEAGNLPQSWAYLEDRPRVDWLNLETYLPDGTRYYRDIRFTPEAVHIHTWMIAHGIQSDKWE